MLFVFCGGAALGGLLLADSLLLFQGRGQLDQLTGDEPQHGGHDLPLGDGAQAHGDYR